MPAFSIVLIRKEHIYCTLFLSLLECTLYVDSYTKSWGGKGHLLFMQTEARSSAGINNIIKVINRMLNVWDN